MRPRPAFRLYLITDRRLAAANGGILDVVGRALHGAAEVAPPGAVAVQLREKDLDARALAELGAAMQRICAQHGAPLLINDRIDVALAIGAAGVHLPADSFDPADARALLGESRLIGVSTHSMEEAVNTSPAADFVVFGPVFDPISKAAYTQATGSSGLAEAAARSSLPLYALGGVTAERIGQLSQELNFAYLTKLAGVAAIGAVIGAQDPGTATQNLLIALDSAK
jgi:thiamine-phosphate pyrophosphorylase